MKATLYFTIVWIILFFGGENYLDAQPCFWSSRSGGTLSEVANSLCYDLEGNQYVAGLTQSPFCYFLTDTIYTVGSNDMFIVKYDGAGNELWIKQLGWQNEYEEYTEGIGGIVFDTLNQRLLVTGTFYQILYLQDTTLYGWGLTGFILNMDPQGQVIWARAIAHPDPEWLEIWMMDITYDEDGDVYVSGCNARQVSFDGIIVPPGGFLAKYDKNGNIQWAKNKFRYWTQWPPNAVYPYTEAPPFNLAYRNGQLFVNGDMYNDTLIIDTITRVLPSEFNGAYLSSFSKEGEIEWISIIKGPKYVNCGQKIAVDNLGGIYQTGAIAEWAIFDEDTLFSPADNGNCFFAKYLVDGSYVWATSIDATGFAYGEAAATDLQNDVYFSGYFWGSARFGNIVLESTSVRDMFVTHFSKEGVCYGVRQYSSGMIPCLSVDHEGNLCMAGMFDDTLTIGGNTFISYGESDLFAAKCSPITGIVQPKAEVSNTLLIYANPNTGQCNVTIPEEFRKEKNLQLQIFDQSGRLVQEARVEMIGELVKLDISAQAKGLYFAVLSNGKKSFQGKIVFE